MGLTPIRYAEFHDVPRVFALEHDGSLYVFDCPFDERADDYPDTYTVYRVPAATLSSTTETSWPELITAGRRVGHCNVSDVHFDTTRRAAVDDAVLARGLTSA
jgi:hypothetical protein